MVGTVEPRAMARALAPASGAGRAVAGASVPAVAARSAAPVGGDGKAPAVAWLGSKAGGMGAASKKAGSAAAGQPEGVAAWAAATVSGGRLRKVRTGAGARVPEKSPGRVAQLLPSLTVPLGATAVAPFRLLLFRPVAPPTSTPTPSP